jgi:hypothetical protein
MRFSPKSSLLIALVLMALLPLRGYASIAHCESGTAPSATHAMHASHCTDSVHSHGCSDCCIVAVIHTPIDSPLPPSPPADAAAKLVWAPPALTLDRLDRPPRSLL